MAYTLTAEDEAEIVLAIKATLAAMVIPAANAEVGEKARVALAVAAADAAIDAYAWQ